MTPRSRLQGRPAGRPYGRYAFDGYDPVDVIGHHDECIEHDLTTNFAGPGPFLFDHPTDRIQSHFGIDDFAEQAAAPIGADRDEIGAGLSVVMARQTDGAAAMEGRIVGHPVMAQVGATGRSPLRSLKLHRDSWTPYCAAAVADDSWLVAVGSSAWSRRARMDLRRGSAAIFRP